MAFLIDVDNSDGGFGARNLTALREVSELNMSDADPRASNRQLHENMAFGGCKKFYERIKQQGASFVMFKPISDRGTSRLGKKNRFSWQLRVMSGEWNFDHPHRDVHRHERIQERETFIILSFWRTIINNFVVFLGIDRSAD